MGTAANPSTLVVLLLLLLLEAAPPVSAKFKPFNKTFNFTSNDVNSLQKDSSATINNGALQITTDSANPNFSLLTNLSGRVLYKSSFKLWDGQNNTDRVASFNTSFLVNLNRVENVLTAGEGLAFVVAPDLNLPMNSSGGYLGLTNVTTDRNQSNKIIAIELDTFKNDFNSDPDSNHVGLNINSVTSSKTANLTRLGLELLGATPDESNFFNVWVQYDGIQKVIAVYVANQTLKTDPTPPRPDIPILTSPLDLREVVNEYSYFGFSGSTGNNTSQLNCVLRWNLTVEYSYKKNWLKFGLEVGIPTVVLLSTLVVFVCYCPKWMSTRRMSRQISGEMKSMPGMVREYEFKDLQKGTNNFDVKKKLGEGGFGVVYKGYLKNENLEVAVKMFSRENLKGREDFLKELIINRLKHKNLIQLRGWCHQHGELLLVFDYMPNGSLDKHLFSSDANSQQLSWDLRNKIISGVASALNYLHNEYDKTVIHRDVKASNIMLDSEFNAKLGDFGLARALDNDKSSYVTAEGFCGTKGYIAPEYSVTCEATQQSDVYAFGAVLLEVVCGKRAWTQINGYLVDWVWALHSEGRLFEAVDNRLRQDSVVEQAQRVLLLGLACSHPIASERPKTQDVVEILSGKVDVPHLPLFKPDFVLASLPIREEDNSSAPIASERPKTQDVVQIMSGSMDVPHLPLIKPAFVLASLPMGEEDNNSATTTDMMSQTISDHRSGWTPFAINPETQRPYSDTPSVPK